MDRKRRTFSLDQKNKTKNKYSYKKKTECKSWEISKQTNKQTDNRTLGYWEIVLLVLGFKKLIPSQKVLFSSFIKESQVPGIAAYFKIYFSRDFSSVQHVNYTLNLRVLLFLWQWRRPYHFCEKIALTLTGSQDAIYPLDTF